jgi:hypothetical protein
MWFIASIRVNDPVTSIQRLKASPMLGNRIVP